MKYIALLTYEGQTGPDSSATFLNALNCNENTTVQQIHEWMKRKARYVPVISLQLVKAETGMEPDDELPDPFSDDEKE